MPQRVPRITREDVERVVQRDFAPDRHAVALAILGAYRGEDGRPYRAQLAALKLSSGDLDELRDRIEQANLDFRDVLVAAEYPPSFSRSASMNSLSEPEREAIYEADWRQYWTWLSVD
jgi:hypothetical protein